MRYATGMDAPLAVAPAGVAVPGRAALERRCPRCQGRWLPGPERDGLVVGLGQLGLEMLGLIASVREGWRLPIRGIRGQLVTCREISGSTAPRPRPLPG